ncbi:hypothetical protein [Persephonella sp.]
MRKVSVYLTFYDRWKKKDLNKYYILADIISGRYRLLHKNLYIKLFFLRNKSGRLYSQNNYYRISEKYKYVLNYNIKIIHSFKRSSFYLFNYIIPLKNIEITESIFTNNKTNSKNKKSISFMFTRSENKIFLNISDLPSFYKKRIGYFKQKKVILTPAELPIYRRFVYNNLENIYAKIYPEEFRTKKIKNESFIRFNKNYFISDKTYPYCYSYQKIRSLNTKFVQILKKQSEKYYLISKQSAKIQTNIQNSLDRNFYYNIDKKSEQNFSYKNENVYFKPNTDNRTTLLHKKSDSQTVEKLKTEIENLKTKLITNIHEKKEQVSNIKTEKQIEYSERFIEKLSMSVYEKITKKLAKEKRRRGL